VKRGITERAQPKDGYTIESGAKLVAKVMAKAERVHATADTTGISNFKLGTNQAFHVSGSDTKGGFRE
jgi:hypothetical protein